MRRCAWSPASALYAGLHIREDTMQGCRHCRCDQLRLALPVICSAAPCRSQDMVRITAWPSQALRLLGQRTERAASLTLQPSPCSLQLVNDSPEDCVDTHQLCASWAKDGECDKNPLYMSGDSFNLGRCRASCGACELCASEDLECRKRNRVNAGFLALDEVDE